MDMDVTCSSSGSSEDDGLVVVKYRVLPVSVDRVVSMHVAGQRGLLCANCATATATTHGGKVSRCMYVCMYVCMYADIYSNDICCLSCDISNPSNN